MPPKRKSIETLRADASAKNREADIVHLLQYVPPLIIGPFFWGLKCLITIFFGSLILNTGHVLHRTFKYNRNIAIDFGVPLSFHVGMDHHWSNSVQKYKTNHDHILGHGM